MEQRHQTIAKILLENRGVEDADFWMWLKPGQPVTIIDANKFILASILDYQIRAETAWENARRLAEDILGDPPLIWHTITSVTLDEWNAKRAQYSLHRFPKGHERVWTIGKQIVDRYEGNVLNVWQNQSIDATLYRLNSLGVGEQISRMVVGALIDTQQMDGIGDVKVDIHVKRVLGRAVHGSQLDDVAAVLSLTRSMHPANPWLLDRPLFSLGKQVCSATEPKCSSCYLNTVCAFAIG